MSSLDPELRELLHRVDDLAPAAPSMPGHAASPPARANVRRLAIAASLALVAAAVVGLVIVAGHRHEATSTTTTLYDRTDSRPLLWLISIGGMTTDFTPADAPWMVLYPDGTLLMFASTEWTSYHVDDAEVVRLLELTRTAGLAGHPNGGPLPFIPMPKGLWGADWSTDTFALRTGDVTTSQTVDGPGFGPTGPAFAVRDAYSAIVADLTAVVEKDTPTGHVPITQWAVLDGDKPYEKGNPWTGPPLASLDWTPIGGGHRCAIVTVASWPIDGPGGTTFHMQSGDVNLVRRPLLPTEHTCADVASLRIALGLATPTSTTTTTSSPASSPPSLDDLKAALDQTEWTLATVDGLAATFTFTIGVATDGNVGGADDCNTWGLDTSIPGQYRWTIEVTAVACPGSHSDEQTVVNAVAGLESIGHSGLDLVLRGAHGHILLFRPSSTP